jgi:hypothetical protein
MSQPAYRSSGLLASFTVLDAMVWV